MIKYTNANWQICSMLRLKGSVFPKAMIWALPATISACLLKTFVFNAPHPHPVNISNVVTTFGSSFTYVLGFLLVFRSQQAYSRYWEGVSLVQQTRGQWFNCASSLIAFCTTEPARELEVQQFQHLIVRLISILHCTALQQIADIDDEKWMTIDRSGIDIPSMSYLAQKTEKCEILFQWIQRLIIENIASGVVCAAPPIVSRIFQDLSLGIVNVNSAKKIKEVPFPFPYAQMATTMLIIFSIVAPLSLSIYADSVLVAGLMTFISVTIYWCIDYIAAELEMPFGSDDNDLPMLEFQNHMNNSLKSLLDEHAQVPPTFDLTKSQRVYMESTLSWSDDSFIPPPDDDTADSATHREWRQLLHSRLARKPHLPYTSESLQGLQEILATVTAVSGRIIDSGHIHAPREPDRQMAEPQTPFADYAGEHQSSNVCHQSQMQLMSASSCDKDSLETPIHIQETTSGGMNQYGLLLSERVPSRASSSHVQPAKTTAILSHDDVHSMHDSEDTIAL